LFLGDPKPSTVGTGRRLAEWLAGGEPVTPPKPADPPASDLIAIAQEHIDATTDEARLGRVATRVAELHAAGHITDDQLEELTERINSRRRPAAAAAN
jgi:hypothetical protein